jgi:hypothetical protein
MSSLLSPEQWAHYVQTQLDSFDTFGNDTITYKKLRYNLDNFQEDPESTPDSAYTTYNFPCLINYNYYRVWGVNTNKQSGEKSGQSMAVILNRQKLRETFPTILDAQGNLIYDSNTDLFLHRGLRYTSQGETFLSQEYSSPLWIMLILQRDKRYTAEDKGQQT